MGYRTGRSTRVLLASLAILAATVVALPTAGGTTAFPPAQSSNSVPGALPSGRVLVAGGYSPSPGVRMVGALPPSTSLTFLVGLPSRDPGGFLAYESAVSIPGTGAHHEFLSPGEIARQYGPSSETIASTEGYFAGYGLGARLSPDGLLLTETGSASAVARAFGTSFDEYRGSDGRTFFSHPTAAQLPDSVPVSGVYGLGNVTLLRPAGLNPTLPAPPSAPHAGCTTGPAGLSPCQIWGAYDSAGLIASGTNGTGERIGVVDTYDAGETETALASDLGTFDSLFGLPSPSVTYNYPVPTTQDLNSTYTGWGLEEALDIEWTHASAPRASLAMTFAPNSGVGLYLAVDWLVSHRLVDVISLSWGEPDVGIFNAYKGACTSECNASTDGSYEILSPVLEAAAVEGIGVFVATGDCGAADGTSGLSTDYPASDPSAVAVGGTSLSVTSSGVYQSEVGWNGNSSGRSSPGCQNQGGSGGGYSPFPRPYWQAGTGVPASPATRGAPDVAADASTGVTIVQGGGEGGVGGTSLATPIWAGIAALADQYAGHDLGQLDPAVYSILRGSNYSTDFHDIVSGNNGYLAGTGWDPVTGVGTPIVGQMVKDLAQPLPSTSSLRVLLYSNRTYGPAPLAVRFALAPSGGRSPYPLEGVYFGDGTSALVSGGAVTHSFPIPGVYAAVAFVADSTGNLTSSDPVAVVVGGGGPLNVTLTPSTSTPGVDAGVTFTTIAQGGSAPYGYLYSFGDGTFVNFSSASSTVHAYGAAGGYCASVIANDSAHPVDGARSAPVAIAVGGAPTPVCSNALAPLTVTADAAPGVRDAPADFPSLFQVGGGVTGSGGNGTTETLSSSDPYVAACACTIFRTPGTYTVSLSATDLIGDHAANETNVTVAAPLNTTFTATATYGPAPLTVQLGVTVTGGYLANASATRWNFGDGTGAAGAQVSHTYTQAGFYSATGDATDRGQGNSSEGFLIDVLPSGSPTAPALTATFAPAVNLSSGTTIRFAAHTSLPNGSSAPAQIFWDLGANGTAWGSTAAQTYYAGGVETSEFLYASVSAEWAGGAPTTEATLVSPQLFASEAGAFVPATDALQLTDSGAPPSGSSGLLWSGVAHVAAPGGGSVNWSYGDGGNAAGPSAEHSFVRAGAYTVNVTASDPWGDTARGALGVLVGPGAVLPLAVSGGPASESGVVPLVVRFAANATGGEVPYLFTWQTGDGTSSTNTSFLHTYTVPGNYTASLTVRDAGGASIELNWTVLVEPVASVPTSGGSSSLVVFVVIAGVVAALAAVSAVLWGRRRYPPPTP